MPPNEKRYYVLNNTRTIEITPTAKAIMDTIIANVILDAKTLNQFVNSAINDKILTQTN